MISVQNALEIVNRNTNRTGNFITKPISEVLDYYLYSDVISPINMPPFRQSAMDGYALSLSNSYHYTIVGEVKAGDYLNPKLNIGDAVRIFTGAAVPDTANAVVMQEKTKANASNLLVDSSIQLHENIRPLGEQIKKGEVALKSGAKLTAAAIGYLCSLGVTKVDVYDKPKIAVVVTGSELAKVGEVLKYGQIYESNSQMLASVLKSLNFNNISTYSVTDSFKDTLQLLDKVISENDVVLVSGGISVGDYDFVGKALNELNVKQLFYKVKQKPGKPLYFGKKENKIIFALPGNPASALSCFYIYVYTALQRLIGNPSISFTKIRAKSNSNFINKGDRSQFLKAYFLNGRVSVLGSQSSAMLNTFALANAFIYVPESTNEISINDEVDVILLPIN